MHAKHLAHRAASDPASLEPFLFAIEAGDRRAAIAALRRIFLDEEPARLVAPAFLAAFSHDRDRPLPIVTDGPTRRRLRSLSALLAEGVDETWCGGLLQWFERIMAARALGSFDGLAALASATELPIALVSSAVREASAHPASFADLLNASCGGWLDQGLAGLVVGFVPAWSKVPPEVLAAVRSLTALFARRAGAPASAFGALVGLDAEALPAIGPHEWSSRVFARGAILPAIAVIHKTTGIGLGSAKSLCETIAARPTHLGPFLDAVAACERDLAIDALAPFAVCFLGEDAEAGAALVALVTLEAFTR